MISTLAVGVLAGPANAQEDRTLLMPGVTYERQVQFTAHGPVAVHVLRAPKPGGLWSLEPVLSNAALVGRERITDLQRALSREATAAGINGDFFSSDGRPEGVLLRSGVLEHGPVASRSSAGIARDGVLHVARVRLFGRWRGRGQRRPLDLNQAPLANGVSIYTPAWGPATPPLAGAVEAVLTGLPRATANVDLTGTVASVAQTQGNTPIPRDGAVLVGRGTGAGRLAAEAPVGTSVAVRLLLSPDWSGFPHAIGGGPVLIRAGRAVFRHREAFTAPRLGRTARSAVGQLRDGRIILVVVDGRQPGYSVGMTNFDLALTLARLGAVNAMGLDVGAYAAMAFDGRLLSRPAASTGEQAVSEGLFVVYRGVYATPPAEEVLSPNADGIGDVQGFAYKLPRPSEVTVELVGPDRRARPLDSGQKGVGVYRLGWRGVTASGQPEPEGTWRLNVSAVDDLGERSSAVRVFSLNRTLGGLSVSSGGGTARARFTLTRPANVSGRIETRSGAVLALVVGGRLSAGARSLAWNGRIGGRRASSGRYVFRVTAVNGLGRVELTAPFALG